MATRVMRIVVGDWSDDGHGKTNDYDYKLEGEDVSDETLKKNYDEMVAVLGVNLFDECSEYENGIISGGLYQKLVENGLNDLPLTVADQLLSFEDYDMEVSLSSVLEVYLKVKVTPMPKPDLLFGGYSGLLRNSNGISSFGYGMFW